jgi:hypothetical protein
VRDGNQFGDLVHAVKLNPVNGLNDAWRVADFFSWHPEAMHVLTYQFDDVGIPKAPPAPPASAAWPAHGVPSVPCSTACDGCHHACVIAWIHSRT